MRNERWDAEGARPPNVTNVQILMQFSVISKIIL